MAADPLTTAVGERICRHMNKDHSEALLSYARHYGGVASPISARMLRLEAEGMDLEVDGVTVRIAFDHVLSDSDDAHQTLVAMLRTLPAPTDASGES
jgi:putative heme iron utilization protein